MIKGKTAVNAKTIIKKSTAPSEAKQNKPISDEEIRLKAYELYLQRNPASGSEQEDWLTAEKIIQQKTA